jgi:hypothetical protein
MRYELIDEVRKQRKMPKMVFYRLINMTDTGFRQSVENKSMKIEVVEKIAKVLEVPVSYFFQESDNIPVTVTPNKQPGIIAKLSGEISVEDLETPGPLIEELTQDIMDEDISDVEKIILLRERICWQAVEIMKLEKLAELRLQNIEKLKKQLAG